MKNYLIYTIIGLLIGGLIVIKANQKPNKIDNQSQATQKKQISPTPAEPKKEENQINYQAFFGEQPNLCEIFPKEKIEELLGKKFVTVKSGSNKTSKYTEYHCEYYQEEPQFKYEGNRPIIPKRLPISIVKGNIQGVRESYKLSGQTVKKDDEIPFPHQFLYNQSGKLITFELFLTDNMDLFINPFQSNLTQEEALDFIKKFVSYFKELTEKQTKSETQSPINNQNKTDSSTQKNQTVPLPQDEDIIRNFVSQIEDGKADEAAKMMKINDQSPPQANSELQAWAVQFSNITSFKLLRMEKANENEWTDTKHIYKVVLDVWMDPRSADAPIPYYGWQNGENTRWLTLEKVGNVWKIAEIATGP